jgi:hypothetical protein
MVLSKTILILEDSLKVLSKILEKLYVLEGDQPYDFSVIIFTNYLQVKQYVNDNQKAEFDIILLDRDCKLGNSFHVLDIERFGADKVIAISSIPEYNAEVGKRGVTHIVEKDMLHLDEFATKVVSQVALLLDADRKNNYPH